MIWALQSLWRSLTPNARALEGSTCSGPTARPWRVLGPRTWHLYPLSSLVSRRADSTCFSPSLALASAATISATLDWLGFVGVKYSDPAHGDSGAFSPRLQYSRSLRKKSAADSSAARGCVRAVAVSAVAISVATTFRIRILPFWSEPPCHSGYIVLDVAKLSLSELPSDSRVVYVINPRINKCGVLSLSSLLHARQYDCDIIHAHRFVETDRRELAGSVKSQFHGAVLVASFPKSAGGGCQNIRMIHLRLAPFQTQEIRRLCRCGMYSR